MKKINFLWSDYLYFVMVSNAFVMAFEIYKFISKFVPMEALISIFLMFLHMFIGLYCYYSHKYYLAKEKK